MVTGGLGKHIKNYISMIKPKNGFNFFEKTSPMTIVDTKDLFLFHNTGKLGMDLFYNLDDRAQDRAEAEMDPYVDWRIRDEILRN